MSPTTAAAEAATDATAIASTDITTNATTNTITNQPTGVSPDNDIEENIPSYNDIGENAPQYDDADRNAGTAPLLPPTYSFAMGPPPPRATWRRMTGGLAAERNAQRNAEISKHPGVYKVYTRKGWFLIVQWFFTFWVLGATAMSLSCSEKLPSVVPMLAYIVACVSTCSSHMGRNLATSPATNARSLGRYPRRPDVLLCMRNKSCVAHESPAGRVVSDQLRHFLPRVDWCHGLRDPGADRIPSIP